MYDVYQIMAGDTIDTIANKFGTNSSVIRQLNPNSGFGVGSMIVVPVTNQYFDIVIQGLRPQRLIKNSMVWGPP